MARTNRTRQALLALLSLGPRTGYDIQRDIKVSIGHFWNESYGQIYPTLRALTRSGLATVTVEKQQGAPDRKVYAITAKGRKELRDWIETRPEPPPVRNEMLLKMFVGWEVSVDTLLDHVTGLLQEFNASLEHLESIERVVRTQRRKYPEATYWLITLRSGVLYTNARIQWCRETLTTLRRMRRRQTPPATRRAQTAQMSELIRRIAETGPPGPKPKKEDTR